jgi:hypothetical protein
MPQIALLIVKVDYLENTHAALGYEQEYPV